MNYTEQDSFKNGTSVLEKSSSLNFSSDKVIPINMTLGASYAELLFTTKSNIGWVFGTAMPTGWILLIILIVIEIFAMPCIRKKGFFQVYNHFFTITSLSILPNQIFLFELIGFLFDSLVTYCLLRNSNSSCY